MSSQSCGVDSATTKIAAQVHRGLLVESWCLTADLRIARANAVKSTPFSTDKDIPVRVHVERPEDTLIIIADKESQTGVLTQVMDQVKLGGVSEVSIATAPMAG